MQPTFKTQIKIHYIRKKNTPIFKKDKKLLIEQLNKPGKTMVGKPTFQFALKMGIELHKLQAGRRFTKLAAVGKVHFHMVTSLASRKWAEPAFLIRISPT